MSPFRLPAEQARVFVNNLRLINRDALADEAIDQLEPDVERCRRRLQKQGQAPRESLREIEDVSKKADVLLQAIRTNPKARRLLEKQAARSIAAEASSPYGAAILAEDRSAVRHLRREANRAAKRVRRQIKPGPRPDKHLRALSATFGRVVEAATGQLPRATRVSLPSGSDKDIAMLRANVRRTGAEARALAVLFHAAGAKLSYESLVYQLQVARAAAVKSRAKRQAGPARQTPATRKHYSPEEKARIVLNGLLGEASVAELCRRKGITEKLYYGWAKELLEVGRRHLATDRPIVDGHRGDGAST